MMMRFFSIRFALIFLLLSCSLPEAQRSPASKINFSKYNPSFKIGINSIEAKKTETQNSVSLEELIHELKEAEFTVGQHPVYQGKEVKYRGFYFKDVVSLLAKKLKIKNKVNYIYSIGCEDNFSSLITNQDLNSGTAFLAWREVYNKSHRAQTVDGLWTLIDKHGSPAPFYLVWDNPQTTYWAKWPNKIASISFVDDQILKKFDSLAPSGNSTKAKGYRLVVQNCTSCHLISNVGFASMGPDLSAVVSYKSEKDFLSQLRKPAGRMVPFSNNILSDEEVQSIYKFLKSVAKNK